jgi:hypothetical protein
MSKKHGLVVHNGFSYDFGLLSVEQFLESLSDPNNRGKLAELVERHRLERELMARVEDMLTHYDRHWGRPDVAKDDPSLITAPEACTTSTCGRCGTRWTGAAYACPECADRKQR